MDERIVRLLNDLAGKRLSIKKERMKNLLEIAVPDEAIYREIMLSMGYSENKLQFHKLSLILPYSQIRELKTKETVEKALLYRAGLSNDKKELPDDFDFSLRMSRKLWKYRNVRPANFPEKRIKQMAVLLYQTMEDGIYKYFKFRIQENYKNGSNKKSAVKAVNKILSFKGLGKNRKLEMFFNILLPFYLVSFEKESDKKMLKFLTDVFEFHPALPDNLVIRKAKSLFAGRHNISEEFPNTAKTYFGLIQWSHNYE